MHLKDQTWNDPKVAKIMPTEDNWGVFKELKGTFWERLIPEVPLDILDRATRGDTTPLMNVGIRSPLGCLKMLKGDKDCEEKEYCINFSAKKCILGNVNMPECFSPKEFSTSRPLILSWLDGFYIVREKIE